MDTFLLKLGCTFLFGFIFFQSIQIETSPTHIMSATNDQEVPLTMQTLPPLKPKKVYSLLEAKESDKKITIR